MLSPASCFSFNHSKKSFPPLPALLSFAWFTLLVNCFCHINSFNGIFILQSNQDCRLHHLVLWGQIRYMHTCSWLSTISFFSSVVYFLQAIFPFLCCTSLLLSVLLYTFWLPWLPLCTFFLLPYLSWTFFGDILNLIISYGTGCAKKPHTKISQQVWHKFFCDCDLNQRKSGPHVRAEKMAMVMFVTWCRVDEQKHNFTKHFCLRPNLFRNRSVCEPRCYCVCFIF